ncbi:hypothetical protein KSP40_PGU020382 [Platanthera guangdongensis]|uniref:Uncharacterized protein n=1 Tax=Platanthera guangdongensis TaxID=2320717 RepID=A0ABR2M333_9ASPA
MDVSSNAPVCSKAAQGYFVLCHHPSQEKTEDIAPAEDSANRRKLALLSSGPASYALEQDLHCIHFTSLLRMLKSTWSRVLRICRQSRGIQISLQNMIAFPQTCSICFMRGRRCSSQLSRNWFQISNSL